MDNTWLISDADKELLRLIWKAIENEPSAKSIVSSQEQISFSHPHFSNQRTGKLLIFLYQITQETIRNQSVKVGGLEKEGLDIFELHYLVVPHAGDDKNDHLLLEKIINRLLDEPSTVSDDQKNNLRLQVKIDSLSLDELNKLWVTLDVPLRLSISLTVSVAKPENISQQKVTSTTIAPQTVQLETKHVTELYQAVLKTFNEQTNGWKNRNIVLKQWVFQDFNKNTGITVDEMLTMLNSLGDKIEQHGTTAPFIKPLNLLARYYKHQLDELQGFHRISRKQNENIETVETWIKDVEALVEALAT